MSEEVYLMTLDGKYLQCINEWGSIELSNNIEDATPFYGDDFDNDLDQFHDGEWAYKGKPLTILTQAKIDKIRNKMKQSITSKEIKELNKQGKIPTFVVKTTGGKVK